MRNIVTRALRSLGWVPASEAAQAAEFEVQLRALSGDPERMEQWRQMALTAGKAGMSSADELAEVITLGMSTRITRLRDLEWARGKTDEEILERMEEVQRDPRPW